MNREQCTSPEESFIECLKNLFDIIDSNHQGFVRLEELTRHLENNKSEARPRMMKNRAEIQHAKIISALHQVVPANGLLSFQRFSLAMKIALGRESADPRRGIGRSLRPRSFLFAVTESSETESDIASDNEEKVYWREQSLSSTLNDEIKNHIDNKNDKNYSLANQQKTRKENSSISCNKSLGYSLEGISEQLLLLKESIYKAEQLREWYCSNFAALETQRRDLENLLSLSEELAESERPCDVFNYKKGSVGLAELDTHMQTLSHLNEKFIMLVGENNGNLPVEKKLSEKEDGHLNDANRKIEEQLNRIQKLEAEKAALVKELFHTRAKLNKPEMSEEKIMPF